MKPRDLLPAPPPGPPIPRFLIREEPTTSQLPQTHLTREDVRVELWAERDRLHIGIQDKETGDYIVSWWDEEASQMFDQGFFYDPGPMGWRIPAEKTKFEESVLAYAESMGILSTGTPGAIEYYFLLSNNEVVSVKAANSTEAREKIARQLPHYGWSVSVVKEIPPPALSPQTQPFAPPGVDSELESLVEAKRREWEGKGYPPSLIARALTMAREWPASMFASRLYQAVRGTPAELEAQRQLYRMGLDVAQRWIEAMHRS